MHRQPLLSAAFHHHHHPHPFHAPALASASTLSYRPLELAHRSAELPAGYNPTPPPPRPPAARMSYAMHSDDDLAQLQKLSSEYEPELTGPLVGPRQSTAAITTEYAAGDPVYRQKTQNLPYKYSHYRTCRGDGHCGWRAIAFGYFEALLRFADRTRFLQEQTRLRSLANLLNQVGFDQDMVADFADETFGLLRKLPATIPSTDESPLLAAFNDDMLSMSIITHLKLLTSAWIQTHPAEFEPFLGQDIRQYCATSIEAANCEIEHVSLTALFQVLLKPAGVALEILYLDRSVGDEGDMYRFDAAGDDGLQAMDAATIRLLYRPGHYDILYKAQDLHHTMIPPTHVAVNLAPHLSEDYVHVTRDFSDVLAYIPGMGASTFAPALGQPSYMPDPFGFAAPVAQQTQPAPQPIYTPLPVSHASQDYGSPTLPMDSPIGLSMNAPGQVERGGPFRPSAYELKQDFAAGPAHKATFQTSIFRNSHYNTAHFLNPDFQPEEWTPDAEYASSARSRHKSASQ